MAEASLEKIIEIHEFLDHLDVFPDIRAVWLDVDEDQYYLTMDADPVIDATDPEKTVPGGTSVHFNRLPRSPFELAVDFAAANVYRAVHESMEWIRVNGYPLADPHPEGADEAIAEECRALVWKYVTRYGTHKVP